MGAGNSSPGRLQIPRVLGTTLRQHERSIAGVGDETGEKEG